MNAYAVRLCFLSTLSNGTARLDVWHGEAIGNPAHSGADVDAQDAHHQVYVGVAATHIADKATRAVTTTMKTEGWIGIAVCVIFRPPALRSAATDTETECFRDLEDWNIFFHP